MPSTLLSAVVYACSSLRHASNYSSVRSSFWKVERTPSVLTLQRRPASNSFSTTRTIPVSVESLKSTTSQTALLKGGGGGLSSVLNKGFISNGSAQH